MKTNALVTYDWVQSFTEKIEEKPDIFIVILILFGVFIAVLIFLFIYHLVSTHEKKKSNIAIAKNTLHVSNYIYHYDTKLITSFAENSPDNQSVIKDIGFYNRLVSKDEQNKVKNWLEGYATNKKVNQPFVTIHSNLGDKKSDFLSVLRIDTADPSKGVVHFEIVTLPSMRVRKSHKKNSAADLRKIAEVKSYATSKKRPRSFVCYYITLTQYVNGSSDMADGKTLYAASVLQPINGLQKYLRKHTATVLVNDREAVIFDFNESDTTSINAFCNTILDEVSRFFSVKGLGDMYHVSIGVSHYDGTMRFDEAVNKAQSLCEDAEEREDTNFLIEGEDKERGNYYVESNEDSITKTIKNSAFRIYFTPVLSLDDTKKPEFQLSVQPYSNKESSFYDIQKAALKQGKLKDFYKEIFLKMKKLDKKVPDSNYIIPSVISGIPATYKALKEVAPEFVSRIIFTIRSDDLKEIIRARLDYRKNLKVARDDGIRLGLYFPKPQVSLSPEVLKDFDLYLVYFPIKDPIYKSQDKELEVNYVKTMLAPYNKEIIFDGLVNGYDIRYASHIGIKEFKAKALEGTSSIPYVDDSWYEIAFGSNDEEDEDY